MASYVTRSKEETMKLASRLAQVLAPGTLVLFSGGLGAGKTAFCEGLARGLGCIDEVSSPTFSIVNVYRGKQPMAHFDLYRVHTKEDLMTAGFYDYLDEGMIVAAEWSENFADLFEDEQAVRVTMEQTGENERKITVEGSALG